MKKVMAYFLIGIVFVFFQSSVLPLLFSPNWRPNLLLILVLCAGLREETLDAIVIGLLLGAIQDSFSGHSLGLYVSVYLAVILSTRAVSEQLNAESVPLLMLLIAGGTLLQHLLVGLFLAVLADVEPVLHILLPAVFIQLLANLCCAFFLLYLLTRTQSLLGFRRGLAGLFHRSSFHGP